MTLENTNKNTLYLIYDDECPLCRHTAHALNIKKAVGNLVLMNVRESHPLIDSVYARGFDPDLGIVVIYNNQYYFGAEAVSFLALLNSSNKAFNRLMARLLRYRWCANIIYFFVKSTVIILSPDNCVSKV